MCVCVCHTPLPENALYPEGVVCFDDSRPERQHHDGCTGGSQPAGGGLAGGLEVIVLQHL